MAERLSELDWGPVVQGPFHPSPASWAEQVLYFLLVDRFSDGRENGYRDVAGEMVAGATPAPASGDREGAVQNEADAARWRVARASWPGGTLAGVRSKIGYLKRMGVTALWISPVLRQRPGTDDYHGYGIQNFLEVDPHFGTATDLRMLVDSAHAAGLCVILDIVLNHTADVFGYAPDGSDQAADGFDPVWADRNYRVAGWRDPAGDPVLPFPLPVAPSATGSAVWSAELQRDGTFTCRGRIVHRDDEEEYREGDFLGYKDVWQGWGAIDRFRPSAALVTLTRACQYRLAFADLDGFRIDTVKHMDPGATRFFTSVIHEFAQTLGKERFFLVGEITGSRAGSVDLMERTGLDAAPGLDDVQDMLESFVKGWSPPGPYFDLFRNSLLVGQGSHTWFRDNVVTSYDDHDQVRKGTNKARFASDDEGRALALGALAANVTTLGIPCIYYGSEQRFDGAGGNDRYIREAMFGGSFGPFRSAGRHCFDEESETYIALAAVLALREKDIALRRGRQYLREISGDGEHFGFPQRWGDRVESIIAWSRIFSDREVVCALNTDTARPVAAWITVDAGLHRAGDTYTPAVGGTAGSTGTEIRIEPLNGLAVRVELPPARFAELTPN